MEVLPIDGLALQFEVGHDATPPVRNVIFFVLPFALAMS